MNKKIRAVIFDIDGVITDGKIYTDGTNLEMKSLNFKDLDAISSMKKDGIMIACISGEDTCFSRKIAGYADRCWLGCKSKEQALEEFLREFNHISLEYICYIGDGKYDIPVLQKVGLSVCPSDAILPVKDISDIILHSSGGEGCLSELYYDILCGKEKKQ